KEDEIREATTRAIDDAKKRLVGVPIVVTTIPHAINGRFGSGKVLTKSAGEGTGCISGGPVRAVRELAGVGDILTTSLGSNKPVNMIRATINGLENLKTAEDVANLRGKSVEELLG